MNPFDNRVPTPVDLTEESLEAMLIRMAKLPGPAYIQPDRMIVTPDIVWVSRTVGIPDSQITFRDAGIIYQLIQEHGRYGAVRKYRRMLDLPPHPGDV